MKNKEEIKQILLKFESDIDNGSGIPNKCIANIDYADLIKDLEKQFTPQWIKVTDRLPKEHKFRMSMDVLTLSGNKINVKSYDYELNRWNGSPHITTTHWMPLPEKPCKP